MRAILRTVVSENAPLYVPTYVITKGTFSSEHFLVANKTLAAYSLVAEGLIAHKSEGVHALLVEKRSADSARARGYARKTAQLLLQKCVKVARNYA